MGVIFLRKRTAGFTGEEMATPSKWEDNPIRRIWGDISGGNERSPLRIKKYGAFQRPQSEYVNPLGGGPLRISTSLRQVAIGFPGRPETVGSSLPNFWLARGVGIGVAALLFFVLHLRMRGPSRLK